MKRRDLEAPQKLLPEPHGHERRGAALSTTLAYVVKELEKELSLISTGDSLSAEQIDEYLASVLSRIGFSLTTVEKDLVVSYIQKEQRPFGIIQDIVEDPAISDIIITDHAKVAIQQGRRNFKTDISFPTPEGYQIFVERLLTRAATSYSTKKPIADGMIGSFARIHAVHPSLCDSGPYVTIRLNRFSSVQLSDLAKTGIAPVEVLDYLSALINSGHTLLIAGEVGTGKTTLARAVASAIPGDESIVVIEDTPEIRLDHPHVRYLSTREANIEGSGRVTPSECIRAGMRMAMNRIIFGEIRDAEAAESFIDVCASGHPGLSTVHAKSAYEAVVRLELFLGRSQKGVEKRILTEQIATAVQAIVHMDICKVTGKRRIMEVKEIGPVADGVLRQRDMFTYSVTQGLPTWRVVTKVSGYKEKLERAEKPFVFSNLSSTLDLDPEVLYRESSMRLSA